MVIGAQVRAYREQRGLTQEQLADRSHLSRNYVSSIENGHRSRVSVGSLDRIAATLGITVDHLLDDAPLPVVSGGSPEYQLGGNQIDDGEVARLVTLYRRLNAKDRKRLLDLAYRLSVKVEPRIVGGEGE